MELAGYLPARQILLNLSVSNKWELIDAMVQAILAGPFCRTLPDTVRERIAETVVQRERQTATGIGNGIAFPHARVAELPDWCVCLATLKEPVDFGSPDGRPVDIAVMAITPEESPTVAIRIMRAVVLLLSDETVRGFFRSQDDPAEIHDYLRRQSLNVDAPITARDIMRPPLVRFRPDMPLREVTAKMHEHHMEAVPVLEDNDTVIGEITCDALFCRGMPAFFSQLSTVSFIREFDPFEKYFQQEAHAVARDVMSSDFATVQEDDTLLEVMYQLSVKKYAKVYVLRNGRLVGIVDRSAVLDRVLNF